MLTLKISKDLSESRKLYSMKQKLTDEKKNDNLNNNLNNNLTNKDNKDNKIKKNISDENFIKYQWSWVF